MSVSSNTSPIGLTNSAQFLVQTSVGPLRVWLAWPEGAPPSSGWPVLWLLDPADVFLSAVETMRFCSRRSDATGIVPGVIVGVEPDVSPGVLDDARAIRETLFVGAHRTALLEAIDGVVRERVMEFLPGSLDGERQVIAGHSLSGLWALYAAFTRPGRFRGVAAVSPSLWQHANDLQAQLEAFPSDGPPLDVLLTVGAHEQGLAPWEVGREGSETVLARRSSRRMIDANREFAGKLETFSASIRAQFRELADADHATARVLSLPLILRLLVL